MIALVNFDENNPRADDLKDGLLEKHPKPESFLGTTLEWIQKVSKKLILDEANGGLNDKRERKLREAIDAGATPIDEDILV